MESNELNLLEIQYHEKLQESNPINNPGASKNYKAKDISQSYTS